MEKLATSKELMFSQINVDSQKTLFQIICGKALEKGFVKAEFYQDLLEREETYPTGLDTPIPMAIPHVGTHCCQSFLSLATLKTPIEFEKMDGSEGTLPVRIVIMFGIVNPNEQVEVLQKLSCLFQNKPFLEKLAQAPNSDALLAVLDEVLENLFVVL
ncbi:MAG: PTS sugar transporter subunit IIA [Peptococcia bacterium]|jgi:PTS system galactitol-specific IIA component